MQPTRTPALRVLLLALLLLLALPIAAQDAQENEAAEAEAELPVIPYFKSSTGFNVPILETWANQSDGATASFTNEELQARIFVTAYDGLDEKAAIRRALETLLGAEASAAAESRYEGLVNLADGTWEQELFLSGDQSVSALAKTREGRTYVVAFVEAVPAAETWMFVVQNPPQTTEADPLPGVREAAQTVLSLELPAVPDAVEAVSLPSGTWTRASYSAEDAQVAAFGLVFGSATYVALTTGDTEAKAAAADAFNTIFLGFFLTPDNSLYLYLGLIVTAVIMLGLIGSMLWRINNARKDARMLAALESSAS